MGKNGEEVKIKQWSRGFYVYADFDSVTDCPCKKSFVFLSLIHPC